MERRDGQTTGQDSRGLRGKEWRAGQKDSGGLRRRARRKENREEKMLDNSRVLEKVRRTGDDSRDVKERTEEERGDEENTEYDSRRLRGEG